MAETDFKALGSFPLYNKKLDANSISLMSVKPSGSRITRAVYFPLLKLMCSGYELIGTLTAGSTSVTLSSAATETYNDQHTYSVGSRVSHTDDDEVTRNYMCIKAVTTAANWQTNAENFAEYTPLDSNSTVDIFTSVFGVNPTDVTISGSSVTLTFEAQQSDVGVKVRVT
ncbi:MAG: hypothetical protein IJ880_03335 [Bacilli bacterium]|nr:hypothetical protein [Bacilli bacterium]